MKETRRCRQCGETFPLDAVHFYKKDETSNGPRYSRLCRTNGCYRAPRTNPHAPKPVIKFDERHPAYLATRPLIV